MVPEAASAHHEVSARPSLAKKSRFSEALQQGFINYEALKTRIEALSKGLDREDDPFVHENSREQSKRQQQAALHFNEALDRDLERVVSVGQHRQLELGEGAECARGAQGGASLIQAPTKTETTTTMPPANLLSDYTDLARQTTELVDYFALNLQGIRKITKKVRQDGAEVGEAQELVPHGGAQETGPRQGRSGS